MSFFSRSRRLPVACRALATAMALAVVTAARPALSNPADIFETAAPVIDSSPPPVTPSDTGESSVSANGSLEYSYPIKVPPGRHGMQPHIALHYSSQAPIYGGIAAGWTLDVPIITLDTTHTLLRDGTPAYHSSLNGGRCKSSSTAESVLRRE